MSKIDLNDDEILAKLERFSNPVFEITSVAQIIHRISGADSHHPYYSHARRVLYRLKKRGLVGCCNFRGTNQTAWWCTSRIKPIYTDDIPF